MCVYLIYIYIYIYIFILREKRYLLETTEDTPVVNILNIFCISCTLHDLIMITDLGN